MVTCNADKLVWQNAFASVTRLVEVWRLLAWFFGSSESLSLCLQENQQKNKAINHYPIFCNLMVYNWPTDFWLIGLFWLQISNIWITNCSWKYTARNRSHRGIYSGYHSSISIEWILYAGLLPVLAWRGGNIARSAKSIYIAAGLGNKKIRFPFSPHHPSYNKRWLSTKGASAISPMQWRTWINVLEGGL
jgi:hypothetical protein